MREAVFILTNNLMVLQQYGDSDVVAGGFRDVLLAARDHIHGGRRLLNHPLAGSVKPNETPYKSLVLTVARGTLDHDSLTYIENAIVTTDKFAPVTRIWPDPERIDRDFQTIDLSLLDAALEGLSDSLFVLKALDNG